ncbi:hypothetical protein VUR80DRAFT_504 [Thermomyces stellatus]
MDEAFKQHSRRKRHSANNLANLSLAPLTTKLPVNDLNHEEVSTSASRTYLEGKSAPTTPRLLSRTPTHSTLRLSPAQLPKSKSATHLGHIVSQKGDRGVVSGTATPRRRKDDRLGGETVDSDWFLRTGALMTSEAREYKGQAWLVSRASSTSLVAAPDSEDEDEDLLERELSREREFASRRSSRRGSLVNGNHHDRSPSSAPRSRQHSRPGSRSLALDRVDSDGYFSQRPEVCEDIPGPDFVNLDERLEALSVEPAADDEAAVRRLVRRGQSGRDSWLASVLGWSLFSVEEREEEVVEEESEDGDDEEERALPASSRCSSTAQLDRLGRLPEERMPPPAEAGGWRDAAWLLTVASKIIF